MSRLLPLSDSSDVLAVEDDAELREQLIDTLSVSGYSALPAANGKEALAHLAGHRRLPKLVVLDLNMPIMGGKELLAILRSYKRLSSVPVLVISAIEADVEDGSAPLVTFLKKPLDTATFMNAVERWLRAPQK